MNVIKQDFHGPARWFSGQKVLPATFCHQSSVPRTYMMEWENSIPQQSSDLHTQCGTLCPASYTHTCLPGMHGALGSIPSNWEKRWGGSGRRKEWRRNIYERNLELCKWPSCICPLPHAPGHTLNAAPCICHLLPCPPACLPVISIFLLTRMTHIPLPRHRFQFSAGT